MLGKIPGHGLEDSRACLRRFWGTLGKISENV